MTPLKYLGFFLLLLAFVSCGETTTVQSPDEEEWVDLFNGENLEGWDLKFTGYELNDNYANTFRVEDGLLKVRYDEFGPFEGQFGHIFYNEPYSYYRLAVEYRFVGEQAEGGPGWALRNNGIMYHSQSAASMGLDQDFPISIEVQLLGGNGEDERSTVNMCSPGTHIVYNGALNTNHCINSSSRTYHGDQWVTAELVVLGDSLVQHIVGGEVVMEYTNPQIGGGSVSNFDPAVKQDGQLLSSGYIALQAESHPTDFRSIRLLNLEGCMDPEAVNYKSYFVEANEAMCEYD